MYKDMAEDEIVVRVQLATCSGAKDVLTYIRQGIKMWPTQDISELLDKAEKVYSTDRRKYWENELTKLKKGD